MSLLTGYNPFYIREAIKPVQHKPEHANVDNSGMHNDAAKHFQAHHDEHIAKHESAIKNHESMKKGEKDNKVKSSHQAAIDSHKQALESHKVAQADLSQKQYGHETQYSQLHKQATEHSETAHAVSNVTHKSTQEYHGKQNAKHFIDHRDSYESYGHHGGDKEPKFKGPHAEHFHKAHEALGRLHEDLPSVDGHHDYHDNGTDPDEMHEHHDENIGSVDHSKGYGYDRDKVEDHAAAFSHFHNEFGGWRDKYNDEYLHDQSARANDVLDSIDEYHNKPSDKNAKSISATAKRVAKEHENDQNWADHVDSQFSTWQDHHASYNHMHKLHKDGNKHVALAKGKYVNALGDHGVLLGNIDHKKTKSNLKKIDESEKKVQEAARHYAHDVPKHIAKSFKMLAEHHSKTPGLEKHSKALHKASKEIHNLADKNKDGWVNDNHVDEMTPHFKTAHDALDKIKSHHLEKHDAVEDEDDWPGKNKHYHIVNHVDHLVDAEEIHGHAQQHQLLFGKGGLYTHNELKDDLDNLGK